MGTSKMRRREGRAIRKERRVRAGWRRFADALGIELLEWQTGYLVRNATGVTFWEGRKRPKRKGQKDV